MNLLDRLERRIEQLAEGLFTRWAGGQVHPFEIGRELLRALDRESRTGDHGLILPNIYQVFLRAEDVAPYRGVDAVLITEFTDALHARAEELGGRFEGPLRIEIGPGSAVAAGEVSVIARFAAEQTPSGALTPRETGPRLRVLIDPSSGQAGHEFALSGPVTAIGRGADQAIVLSDPGVSRMHARVEVGAEGAAIVDLGSTNGTVVNGVSLRAARAPLQEGDRIQIGRVILQYLTR